MEFIASKKEFMSALTKAQGIPEQKNLSSPMANLLIESIGTDTVRLTAMSYEVTMTTSFPAKVEEGGQMALCSKSLVEAARMLPEAPITLKSSPNEWAILCAGRSEYRIPGILPSSMPERLVPQATDHICLSKELIMDMVDRVSFAMSSDEGRLYLNGVFLLVDPSPNGTRIESVATDGHRLSRMIRFVGVADIPQTLKVIIHRKGVSEIRRFLDDGPQEVTIGFQRNAVTFLVPNGYLYIRQIELDYPDYMRVFPTEFKASFLVDRAELIKTIQRASVILSPDRGPVVRFKIEPEILVISAQDQQRGFFKAELNIEQVAGEQIEIAYNYRYALEALNALRGEKVTFGIKDHQSATRIESPTDEGVTQLIMPIKF